YPRLSPALVGEAIISTTRNRPPGGYDDQVGFGTVDAADALTAAAHLARQGSGGHGASASGFFGGGPATVSAAPVKRRGPGALILLILLGAGCLAIVVTATWRLVTVRSEPQADEVPGGGPALAAAGRPDAYPAQAKPAERGRAARCRPDTSRRRSRATAARSRRCARAPAAARSGWICGVPGGPDSRDRQL